MEIKKSFGNKIRTLRKALWLSQEDFAFKVKLHRTYIGMVERGEKNISLENIEKIAKALWVKIKDLFEHTIDD
jgi:transcriptional regulator with XRE-family HTH domain